MSQLKTITRPTQGKRGLFRELWRQRELQFMALPALIALVLFSFLPLFGLQIAFKDYKMNMGMFGGEWVGLCLLYTSRCV